jgi:hypothetical protein
MDLHTFSYNGKDYTISKRAKFLVETANGTSSYTLERGFAAVPDQAIEFYDSIAAGGNKKKRLTLVDNGQRTVVARHPK